MGGPSSVGAVVVTRNRCRVLDRTLTAVARQTRPPEVVCVVDNASTDGTADRLASAWPGVDYVRLPGNLGFGAGLATGMRRWAPRHEFLWLLDDDSPPAPTALARLLGAAARSSRCAVVGLDGGTLCFGVPRHWAWPRGPGRPDRSDALRADFALLDGALVRAAAASSVGYPRADFFMMMEDVEYTDRLARAGWEVRVLAGGLIERGHLGSGADGRGVSPPWRGYYQARNHLAMAICHRSPGEVAGWFARQVWLSLGALRAGDRVVQRTRLRGLGAWHGLVGVTGRTVEPDDPRPGTQPSRQ